MFIDRDRFEFALRQEGHVSLMAIYNETNKPKTHMELLTEFVRVRDDIYKHGAPDGVPSGNATLTTNMELLSEFILGTLVTNRELLTEFVWEVSLDLRSQSWRHDVVINLIHPLWRVDHSLFKPPPQ